MKYVLDRVEEGIAVLQAQNGNLVRLPLSALPAGAEEGSVLREEGGAFVPDEAAAEARRAALLALQQALLFDDDEA